MIKLYVFNMCTSIENAFMVPSWVDCMIVVGLGIFRVQEMQLFSLISCVVFIL